MEKSKTIRKRPFIRCSSTDSTSFSKNEPELGEPTPLDP
jgi:hypothetical protein